MFKKTANFFLSILHWIFSHKKITFIYFPLLCGVLMFVYVFIIYLSYLSNKDEILDKLSRYKTLIDKTEEMKKGMAFSAGEFSADKKVVSIPTRIYDRNGEIIGEFFEEKREIVPLHYIPETLINAVIASEDRDFYRHKGINYSGLVKVMIRNIRNFQLAGGSTVTQQLAKVLFTDMERSVKRKVYEAFLALEIERRYDKKDILSMYLNLIYFGNSSYGVESTSKMYFGKSVKDLTDGECAMVVATISNPMIYSPLNRLNNSVVKSRRILQSLVDSGFLEQKKADYEYSRLVKNWKIKFNDKDEAVESLIGSFIYSTYRINRAPFFNEYIRRTLSEKFGDEALKKGGFSIYTTIDAVKQDVALASMRTAIDDQRKYHLDRAASIKNKEKADEEREKADNIQGAFVTLNPYSGEIINYVGGYAFTANNQLDHVMQMRRQPGSSFKPFIYCSAIENKDITPATMMVDEKTKFSNGYTPQNYSGTFSGNIIIREALRKSINVIAVKVLDKTGYDKVLGYVKKALDLPDAQMHDRFGKTLSLALGTYELSPLENATLHSTLVNGGQFIKPYGILYVKDYENNIVWNNEEEITREVNKKREEYGTIIDPSAAAVTIDMLKGVFQPGGTASGTAARYGINFPAAGKTGTSTNWNDAWFAGYTRDLVSVVWIGNNKGAITLGRGRAGGVLSAPVWGRYISFVYRQEKPLDFIKPEEGLTFQTICLDSGKVPVKDEYCPHISKDELFIAGTEPGEYCDLHTGPDDKEKKSDEKIQDGSDG
ncbi:MAG: transglycosylase domain-containing protein [Spirochaetes bacterium]|nr:transglycosylase domain-containing protein [Spirochaetota bacterium]